MTTHTASHDFEEMAAKMVNQITSSMADIRESFGTCQTGHDLVTAYREPWDAACVVVVGGKAQRHAMQLPALCTCLEFVLYFGCEHSCFVEALDLPIRAKLRHFQLFKP